MFAECIDANCPYSNIIQPFYLKIILEVWLPILC